LAKKRTTRAGKKERKKGEVSILPQTHTPLPSSLCNIPPPRPPFSFLPQPTQTYIIIFKPK